MVEQTFDRRNERAELEPVACRKSRWRRAVLGQHAMIAGAECDRDKARGITKRDPTCEPDLDWFAARPMHPVQARGQSRRVVGDDTNRNVCKPGHLTCSPRYRRAPAHCAIDAFSLYPLSDYSLQSVQLR